MLVEKFLKEKIQAANTSVRKVEEALDLGHSRLTKIMKRHRKVPLTLGYQLALHLGYMDQYEYSGEAVERLRALEDISVKNGYDISGLDPEKLLNDENALFNAFKEAVDFPSLVRHFMTYPDSDSEHFHGISAHPKLHFGNKIRTEEVTALTADDFKDYKHLFIRHHLTEQDMDSYTAALLNVGTPEVNFESSSSKDEQYFTSLRTNNPVLIDDPLVIYQIEVDGYTYEGVFDLKGNQLSHTDAYKNI